MDMDTNQYMRRFSKEDCKEEPVALLKILAENLRELRKLKKVTQADVAKKLAITLPSYSKYESGTLKSISFENLEKLGKYFHLRPYDLLSQKLSHARAFASVLLSEENGSLTEAEEKQRKESYMQAFFKAHNILDDKALCDADFILKFVKEYEAEEEKRRRESLAKERDVLEKRLAVIKEMMEDYVAAPNESKKDPPPNAEQF